MFSSAITIPMTRYDRIPLNEHIRLCTVSWTLCALAPVSPYRYSSMWISLTNVLNHPAIVT